MRSGNRPIKVIVVDDHQIVRRGLISLLGEIAGIKVVGGASSGEQAVDLIRQLQPEVVLMDLFLPGADGIETSSRILRIDPDLKILVLTTSESEILSAKLLDEGVAGYLTKDCSIDEIVKAIRMVAVGRRYVTPAIAQKLALKRYTKEKEESPFDSLSKRELQIVMKIVAGQTMQEIADVLTLSPKTISTHRHRFFHKLRIKNDVELTLLALRHNLIEHEA